MLVSAADRAEILRHVREAEASGRAGHPLVRLLRRIALPEDAITVTLPPAVSANRYWSSRIVTPKGGKPFVSTYVSSEAKAYKESVAWLMKAAGVHKPFPGRVAAHIAVYPHRPLDYHKRMRDDPLYWADTVQRLDLGNNRKTIEDALNGIAYTDDKCIWMDGGEVMEPDGREACVVLTLWPLVLTSPQATLMQPDKPKAIQAPPQPRQPALEPIYADDGSTLPF